jgi:alkylation response protein AidB-like acyl-CoA dehydrogenase
VRIPLDNLVGPLNEGWRVNRTTMAGEHLTNFLGSQAAQASTIARIARAVAERETKLGVDHDLRRRLAAAWATTQVVNLHGLRNVARFTSGDTPGAESSISKLVGQESEKAMFELLIDAQGADGLMESTWTRAYLSTRASTIGGGTSEIHRNKLAERVLGMPRDPWADEDMPETGAAA